MDSRRNVDDLKSVKIRVRTKAERKELPEDLNFYKSGECSLYYWVPFQKDIVNDKEVNHNEETNKRESDLLTTNIDEFEDNVIRSPSSEVLNNYNSGLRSDDIPHLLHSDQSSNKDMESDYESNGENELEKLVLSNHERILEAPISSQDNDKIFEPADIINEIIQKEFKCTICKYKTTKEFQARKHALIHTDIKLFKCSDCIFYTYRKENLQRHMNEVHNLKSIKVSDYNVSKEEYNAVKDFSFHILTEVPKSLFTCSVCCYETYNIFTAEEHILNHYNRKVEEFKCSECGFKTGVDSLFKIHTLGHQRILEITNNEEGIVATDWEMTILKFIRTIYTCLLCFYKTFDISHANRHSLTHCENLMSFKCSQCKFGTTRKEKIQEHLNQMHEIDSLEDCEQNYNLTEYVNVIQKVHFTEVAESLFAFSFHDFEFMDDPLVTKSHFFVHSDTKLEVYKCYECDFETECTVRLKDHVTERHDTNLIGNLLDRNYVFLKMLANISGITANDKNSVINCLFCDYHTLNSSVANKHLLAHSNVKVSKCFNCRDGCNLSDTTRQHESVHSQKKLLISKPCQYEDIPVEELITDEPLIEGNLFRCSHCDFTCNNKNEFEWHIFSDGKKSEECKELASFLEEEKINPMETHINTKTDVNCTSQPGLDGLRQPVDYINQTKVDSVVENPQLLVSDDRYSYKCFECNYVTDRKAKYQIHLEWHERKLKLIADSGACKRRRTIVECLSCLPSKSVSKEVQSKKSSKKVNKCPECDQEIDRKSFKRHLLSHSESLPSTPRLSKSKNMKSNNAKQDQSSNSAKKLSNSAKKLPDSAKKLSNSTKKLPNSAKK